MCFKSGFLGNGFWSRILFSWKLNICIFLVKLFWLNVGKLEIRGECTEDREDSL